MKIIEIQEILAEEKGVFIGVEKPLHVRALDAAINIIEEQNGLFCELEAIRKRRLGYNPERNKTARKLMELVGEIARKGIKLTEE